MDKQSAYIELNDQNNTSFLLTDDQPAGVDYHETSVQTKGDKYRLQLVSDSIQAELKYDDEETARKDEQRVKDTLRVLSDFRATTQPNTDSQTEGEM